MTRKILADRNVSTTDQIDIAINHLGDYGLESACWELGMGHALSAEEWTNPTTNEVGDRANYLHHLNHTAVENADELDMNNEDDRRVIRDQLREAIEHDSLVSLHWVDGELVIDPDLDADDSDDDDTQGPGLQD